MHDQLLRLADASTLPNVTIQVMPFSGGAHSAMDGSFNILGFPDPVDHQVVYIEYQTGRFIWRSARRSTAIS
jgi:hypothetical protein